MVKLTLKQCAYFVAVANHGGIAQAARVLNISQPAVAQSLDKLEQICGLSLFTRHHARGVELTPQGRAFIDSARGLLEAAEHTENEAQAIAADLAGNIRLGCFHTIAPFYLANIIKTYRDTRPGVEIIASELLQDEIVSALKSGRIDLAISYDMSLDNELLEKQVLAKLKPFILLSENHSFADRSSIRLADLSKEPYVMFDGPSSRTYFDQVLTSHGIKPPISFNARSIESVQSAVSSGLGFSLSVMKLNHADAYGGGGVVMIPIAENVRPISIVAVRKKNYAPSSLIDQFIAFCKQHFSQH